MTVLGMTIAGHLLYFLYLTPTHPYLQILPGNPNSVGIGSHVLDLSDSSCSVLVSFLLPDFALPINPPPRLGNTITIRTTTWRNLVRIRPVALASSDSIFRPQPYIRTA